MVLFWLRPDLVSSQETAFLLLRGAKKDGPERNAAFLPSSTAVITSVTFLP